MAGPAEPSPHVCNGAYYEGLAASIAAGDYTVAGPVEIGPGYQTWRVSPRAIPELSVVELTRGIPEAGITAGTRGTVVGVYAGNGGYEVEFTDADGRTIAVVTLGANDIRMVDAGDSLGLNNP